MKNNAKIPGLYETEGIELDDKIIHEAWAIPRIRFYWLIAELDPKENLAIGYANLNDDINAEWGYISIEELKVNKVKKIDNWVPTKFSEAKKKIEEIIDASTEVLIVRLLNQNGIRNT